MTQTLKKLPVGMHDLLPDEARARRELADSIMKGLSLAGYEELVVPLFEFSSVTDAGLGTLDQDDVLRFIEPESGEVASLRPDLTPQVARICATRLSARPGPYRLACEGVVMRRRAGHARKHRQIAQVGAELIGLAGEDADYEQIALSCEALLRAGLTDFLLELSHAGIVRALIGDGENVTAEQRLRVTTALAQKDTTRVASTAKGLVHADALVQLSRAFGDRNALSRVEKICADTPAASAVNELSSLFSRAERARVAPRIACDPGEVRNFAYYTGFRFSLFAEGPGESIGGGGRYDSLLEKFGAPQPAVGFALHLDNLAWARAASSARHGCVLTHDASIDAAVDVTKLRAMNVRVVVVRDEAEALAYARAWGYSFVVTRDAVLTPDGQRALPGAPDGSAITLAALAKPTTE